MSVLDMAVEERRELLDLLRGLSEDQWNAPTLCAGWRVRDVVAHVISYEDLGPADLARRFLKGRLRLSRTNEVGLSALRDAPTPILIEAVERRLRPSGLTTAFGGRIALTDFLIHQQDIRRPLGLPRTIPAERLRETLNFALFAPPIRGAWNLRGVKVAATDLNWSFGAGPEVRGPGEAVLMAMAGRRGVTRDLDGPGAERLGARLD